MRAFLIAVVLVLIAAFLGWLTFADSDGKATVTLDKNEIQKDTDEAVEKTKDVFNDAKNEVESIDEN